MKKYIHDPDTILPLQANKIVYRYYNMLTYRDTIQ